ncbi:MAG: hypothetical protein HN348_14895 [Proteobacteria bacterium]|jgi:hypothetical protein|nr:hypothetical protein [Pseudomonadota bacterium]
MLKVTVLFLHTMTVPAMPEDVYRVVADVPDSVAHFPDLAALVPENGGYTWHFAPRTVAGFTMQTIYACQYHTDESTLSVSWTPITGVGNATVSGYWTIEPANPGTRLSIDYKLVLDLDLPSLVRSIAEPIVIRENTELMERYLANLKTTFQGGNGRVHDQGWPSSLK